MTKKETNSTLKNSLENYNKLSIQISLNGLSFCVVDTISNTIEVSESISFKEEHNPHTLLKQLKTLFKAHSINKGNFSEVVVLHRNSLFSLVPKALFNADDLANYLKFNAKILANDLLVYDEIINYEVMNVYVPFVNINNYIYELFGEFEYKHIGTVMIDYLLSLQNTGNDAICYVHIAGKEMDIAVIAQKKLVLYNNFVFTTPADFMYYLLFTLEQLDLDSNVVKVRLMGSIDEKDEIYNLCQKYIGNIAIFFPSTHSLVMGDHSDKTIDFTILNTL